MSDKPPGMVRLPLPDHSGQEMLKDLAYTCDPSTWFPAMEGYSRVCGGPDCGPQCILGSYAPPSCF